MGDEYTVKVKRKRRGRLGGRATPENFRRVWVEFKEVSTVNIEASTASEGGTGPVPWSYPVFVKEADKWKWKDDENCEKWIYVFRRTKNNKIVWYREIKANILGEYQLVKLDKKTRKANERQESKKAQKKVDLIYEEKVGEKYNPVKNYFCLSRIQLSSERVEELRKGLERSGSSDRLKFQDVRKSSKDVYLIDYIACAARWCKIYLKYRDRYVDWLRGYCDPTNCPPENMEWLTKYCKSEHCPLKPYVRLHKPIEKGRGNKLEYEFAPRASLNALSVIVHDICALDRKRTEEEERALKEWKEKKSSEIEDFKLRLGLPERYWPERDRDKVEERTRCDKGERVNRWMKKYQETEGSLKLEYEHFAELLWGKDGLLNTKEFKAVLHDYEPSMRSHGLKLEEDVSIVTVFLSESDVARVALRERCKEAIKYWLEGKKEEKNWNFLTAIYSRGKIISDAFWTVFEEIVKVTTATQKAEDAAEAITKLANIKTGAEFEAISRKKTMDLKTLKELRRQPRVLPRSKNPLTITGMKGTPITTKPMKTTEATVEVIEVKPKGEWVRKIKKMPWAGRCMDILGLVNVGLSLNALLQSKKTADKVKNGAALLGAVTGFVHGSNILAQRWTSKFGKFTTRVCGIVSGFIDAALGGYEYYENKKEENYGASHASTLVVMGGLICIVGVFVGFPWNLIGALVVGIGWLILNAVKDDDLKSWLRHCFWGLAYGSEGNKDWAKGHRKDKGFFKEWVGDLDQQIRAFHNIWFSFEIATPEIIWDSLTVYKRDERGRARTHGYKTEYSELMIRIKPVRITEHSRFILSAWIRNDKRASPLYLAEDLLLDRTLFPEKSFGEKTQYIDVYFVDECYFELWQQERRTWLAARAHQRSKNPEDANPWDPDIFVGIQVFPEESMDKLGSPALRKKIHASNRVDWKCEARLDVSGDGKTIVPSWGDPKKFKGRLEKPTKQPPRAA